jgi:lipoprotein-anchoring transpeptidase ErfK/SrfK
MDAKHERAPKLLKGVGCLFLAATALTACQENIDVQPEQIYQTAPSTPSPLASETKSPEPERIKVELPLDKRCYSLGRVACIELEKTPEIQGTIFAMKNGKVQFKVPVRSGSTNHTDGNSGIYTPRCETTIQRKEEVIYSTLLENTVGLIPMYNSLSIACTDEIHDKSYHGGVYIHGSLDFDSYGYKADGYDGKPRGSHGCVNVHYANGDSKKVFNYFELGDKAVVYDKTTQKVGYEIIKQP